MVSELHGHALGSISNTPLKRCPGDLSYKKLFSSGVLWGTVLDAIPWVLGCQSQRVSGKGSVGRGYPRVLRDLRMLRNTCISPTRARTSLAVGFYDSPGSLSASLHPLENTIFGGLYGVLGGEGDSPLENRKKNGCKRQVRAPYISVIPYIPIVWGFGG